MYDDPRTGAIFQKFTGLQTFSGIAKLYLNAFSLEVTKVSSLNFNTMIQKH